MSRSKTPSQTLTLDLLTPEALVLESVAALSVVLPAQDGDICVLAQHTPMVISLRPGLVQVDQKQGSKEVLIAGGVADILADRITLWSPQATAMTRFDPEPLKRDVNHFTQALEQATEPEIQAHLSQQLTWTKMQLEHGAGL